MRTVPSIASGGGGEAGAPYKVAGLPAEPTQSEVAVSATHDALFREGDVKRCDACGQALAPKPADEDDADGYGVAGQGVYLWTRGDEVRLERVPLCAPCASAIGMTALARWEIEEEEG